MPQSVSKPTFLIFGAVIWFAALLLIRLGGAMLFSLEGPRMAILFLLTFPGSWASTRFCLRLGRTPMELAVPAVALMSLAALLLDGVVFTWFPFAYGDDPAVVRLGAAWLLWAVGVFLAVAFFVGRPRQTP